MYVKVRPPQPSIYHITLSKQVSGVVMCIYFEMCFLLVGMLGVFCSVLLENLAKLPGDARTMVGFLTYDSTLHFYNLKVEHL